MRKLPLLMVVIVVSAALMFGAAPANAQSGRTYVVQPGDTLFSIAARFNVSVSELATINRIYDVNKVPVGMVLILPNPLPAGFVPVYPSTAQSTGQNPGAATGGSYPSSAGGTAPIYTPPVVTYPPGTTITTVTTYTSYVVRAGDTLASIAQRFKTTTQAILSANAIANPNLIYVGQLLTIPRTTTKVVQPRAPSRPVVSGRIYIVQPGDNLFSIAARFGRDVWSIARSNGILNLNSIYIGQPLIIP
jgi:LysM repeat protein